MNSTTLLCSTLLFISSIFYCQVGINTTSPTKTLDINGDLRIRKLASDVDLNSDFIITADSLGNVKAIPINRIKGNATPLFETRKQINKIADYVEVGCKQWESPEGNDHWYCAYKLSEDTNYFEAVDIATDLGGYLVTLTSHSERMWVYSNILGSGGYNLKGCIWIGYYKVGDIFRWGTGEKSELDYSVNPPIKQTWFYPGEPNNFLGRENAVRILPSYFPDREWNDINPYQSKCSRELIVEFDSGDNENKRKLKR